MRVLPCRADLVEFLKDRGVDLKPVSLATIKGRQAKPTKLNPETPISLD